MGYALLWIESLATSLLAVAVLAAGIGRLRTLWVRAVLTAIVVAGPLICYGAPLIGAPYLAELGGPLKEFVSRPAASDSSLVAKWGYALILLVAEFGYVLATEKWRLAVVLLATLYSVGALWLLWRGIRRDPASSQWTAATWPRGQLAIALGVVVSLHLMTFWNLDMAIRLRLPSLRAEASALALSVAPARIPDAENAAFLYRRAFDAMGSHASWPESRQKDWERWTEPKAVISAQDAALGQFLDEQASAVTLLRQAAAKPGCYFDRDYSRPSFTWLMPEVQSMRQAAILMAVRARWRATEDRPHSSLADVGAIFRFAEHVSIEPLLISQLVAIAIDGVAATTLDEMLPGVIRSMRPFPGGASGIDLEDQFLQPFLHLDAGPSYREKLARAMRLEEASGLSFFAMLGDEAQSREMQEVMQTNDVPALGMGGAFYRVFLLADDVAAYQRIMREMAALLGRPYGEVGKSWDALDEEVEKKKTNVVTRMLVPALRKVHEAAARGDAQRRVVKLGLAAARFRVKHARWPDTAGELVPEWIEAVPTDPFDDKPLRLKRTENGLIVYSVGPDLADQAGTPYDREHRTGDVTFTLHDAPPPATTPK